MGGWGDGTFVPMRIACARRVPSQGCWRSKLGDAVWSEFRMILMDRGVYDGGFNISKANTDPTKASVEE